MNILEMNPQEIRPCAFIGGNVKNSSAVRLYTKLVDFYGLNSVWIPRNIAEDELGDFFKAAKLLKYSGAVICPPHKGASVAYMDETDEISKTFLSVNCVRFNEDGTISGHGFDGKGVIYAFDQRGVELKDKTVMMIGGGGVAGIFASEMAQHGVKKITILNRTLEKAEKIVATMKNMYPEVDVSCMALSVENACEVAKTADIFLQATSLGRKGFPEYEDVSFIDALPANAWVMEAVSNPPETKIVKAAKERGLNYIIGMEMQVCQVESIFKFIYDFDMDERGRKVAAQFFCDLFGYKYEV